MRNAVGFFVNGWDPRETFPVCLNPCHRDDEDQDFYFQFCFLYLMTPFDSSVSFLLFSILRCVITGDYSSSGRIEGAQWVQQDINLEVHRIQVWRVTSRSLPAPVAPPQPDERERGACLLEEQLHDTRPQCAAPPRPWPAAEAQGARTRPSRPGPGEASGPPSKRPERAEAGEAQGLHGQWEAKGSAEEDGKTDRRVGWIDGGDGVCCRDREAKGQAPKGESAAD